MTIKDFIQNNPYRVMGAFTNDSFDILSTNFSRMKAFAAIGKTVAFEHDMERVAGPKPDRQPEALATSMASLSSPEGRLLNGLFWFMNLTDTDAKAFHILTQDGNLLKARKIWEEGEQNMSSLQNQLMCHLLRDSRFYAKALQLASTLYANYGSEFIVTVSNGFEVVMPEELMYVLLTAIVNISNGACVGWNQAVMRMKDKDVAQQWAEAKATWHITKLQDALNVAKATEIHSPKDNHDIAITLMEQAEPHLKALKELWQSHPTLLSRYTTIADAVCEVILEHEIEHSNHSKWFPTKTDQKLKLYRFCYCNAATVRLKNRCQLNINIVLNRKDSAPLLPNGMPDNRLPKG